MGKIRNKYEKTIYMHLGIFLFFLCMKSLGCWFTSNFLKIHTNQGVTKKTLQPKYGKRVISYPTYRRMFNSYPIYMVVPKHT